MASKAKKSKLGGRQFQQSWTEEYGFIPSDGKALCVLCGETVVSRTFSVKRHFETTHANDTKLPKSPDELKQFLKQAVDRHRDNTKKSSAVMKLFTESATSQTAASYEVARVIASHGKPFADGPYLKEFCIALVGSFCASKQEKDSMLQKVRDVSLSDSTI